MNILDKIKPWATEGETINVIVEIQKGSKNKYEFYKETGLIKLDRVMFTGQDYPLNLLLLSTWGQTLAQLISWHHLHRYLSYPSWLEA